MSDPSGMEPARDNGPPASRAKVSGRDNLVRLGGERKSAELSAENSYPLTADEYFVLATRFQNSGKLSTAQVVLLSLSLPWLCSAIVSVFTLEFSKNASVVWGNVIVLILYWIAGLGCLVAFFALLASRARNKFEAEPYERLDRKMRHHLEIERRQQ